MTRSKGSGAGYGPLITRLSDMHKRILKILAKEKLATKQKITAILNEHKDRGQGYVGGFSVSGRLSELCGAGLIRMTYKKVELYDRKSMQFRFVKKPVWSLTETGTQEVSKLAMYA